MICYERILILMFRFKSIVVSVCFSLFCFGVCCSSAYSATVTLITDGTTLMGAENVDVNGTLYDVMFVDGILSDLYNGADENSDFLFYNTDALSSVDLVKAAANALNEQVFVGIYDTNPSLVNGVYTQYSDTATAVILIPYYINAPDSIATDSHWIVSSNYNDKSQSVWGAYSADYDSSPEINAEEKDTVVFAVWTLHETSSVPVPTTVFLLGSGLISLAGVSRKKYSNRA